MPLQRQHIQFQKEFFTHYYLCNYQPRYVGGDELSASLIKFKNGAELHVRAWVECSIIALQGLPFEESLVILRALGKNEIQINTEKVTSLDVLGNMLSENLDARYFPELLSKSRATKGMKMLSKTEREIELSNTYNFENGTIEEIKEVLIIDDILTTGSTMQEIIRATRLAVPGCKISLFTLADTNHQAVLNKDISLEGYSLQWSYGEWEKVAEDTPQYADLHSLKTKILNNSF